MRDMTKNRLRPLAFTMTFLSMSVFAQPTITGVSRADNFHRFYTGASDGSGLMAHGGVISFAVSVGSPSISANTSDYLYIVAWSDDSTQQFLAADLLVDDGVDTNDMSTSSPLWEVYPTGVDIDDISSPALADVALQISGVTSWANVSRSPIGNISNPGNNIGDAIWFDSGAQSSTCSGAINVGAPFCPGFDHQEYLIFRHPIVFSTDLDMDGLPSSSDNCPFIANVDQSDLDGDAIGDVCDPMPNGGGGSGGNPPTVGYQFVPAFLFLLSTAILGLITRRRSA